MFMSIPGQSGSSLETGMLVPSREPGKEQAFNEYLLNELEATLNAY